MGVIVYQSKNKRLDPAVEKLLNNKDVILSHESWKRLKMSTACSLIDEWTVRNLHISIFKSE